MLRQKVFYTGNVQGVGFRYAVVRIAGNYAVAGWVRNLPDGRVELAVEGESEVVQRFQKAVETESPGQITKMVVVDWVHPLTTKGFQVRFDLGS